MRNRSGNFSVERLMNLIALDLAPSIREDRRDSYAGP